MRGIPHQALPGIGECIEANLSAARVVSPDVAMAGICINSKALDDDAANRLLRETEDAHGLPCVDRVRTGVGPVVDKLESL